MHRCAGELHPVNASRKSGECGLSQSSGTNVRSVSTAVGDSDTVSSRGSSSGRSGIPDAEERGVLTVERNRSEVDAEGYNSILRVFTWDKTHVLLEGFRGEKNT
jgi:hypothetical protein